MKIKLYLNTSTDVCELHLNDRKYTWTAGHEMAEGILRFIHAKLLENSADWADISEITYYSGPGSFTGLRIGAAIVNTLAHELQIPLYDHHGNLHEIILPEYGRPANISSPKK